MSNFQWQNYSEPFNSATARAIAVDLRDAGTIKGDTEPSNLTSSSSRRISDDNIETFKQHNH